MSKHANRVTKKQKFLRQEEAGQFRRLSLDRKFAVPENEDDNKLFLELLGAKKLYYQAVNSLTNHQRSMWGKAKYPGSDDKNPNGPLKFKI